MHVSGGGGTVVSDPLVQRLFSIFPSGLPGLGLLLLRAATAIPLIQGGLANLSAPDSAIPELVLAVAGALLLVGLWTPLAGGLIAIVELWRAWSDPADPWLHVHLGVLSAALVMLGPGACSVDARLFGRKHIQIPQR